MYRNKRISLVIPSFNEVEGTRKILTEIPSFYDEIIFVDSSSDETPQVAQSMGARVVTEQRRGYGRAYKTGFAAATGEIIVTMDSDATYPHTEKEVAALLDVLLNADAEFLNTSRFPLFGPPGIMSTVRVVGNTVITFFGNLVFNTRVRDYLSGMWVFKRSILKDLILLSDGWSFSQEIKLEAIVAGKRFVEEHIPYRVRLGEATLVDLRWGQFKVGFLNLAYFVRKRLFRRLQWGIGKPEKYL